ncbi:MAG: aminotransferase class I/II-fold pyridoxal phosphate-dependent enzyme [Thermoanaerobaculia bacterium]|nr:aminotransferase class I/II-fold pyridoxal phosphate-dependent enzyme [Thermoanaerobaculia bacterium]
MSSPPPPEPDPARPLESSPAELRELIDRAAERVVEHVATLADQPASYRGGAEEAAAAVTEPLPQSGAPYAEVLDLVFDRALPTSFNNAGPGFLAFIPGGGLVESAVADLIGDAINRYPTVFVAAPGLYQLEANVVRWFCDLVGYPESAGGFLSSGGSQANFSAVVAARHDRLPPDFLRGTLYASDQVHHSITKAASLAGFPVENVRKVASDDGFRLDPDALREAIAADRRAGLQPFLLVASAGTTNTGAIDPLPELAEIARREELWLHVDAAYGGFFLLTERGRRRLAGIDVADSVTLDPHKGLFLPYGTGCLLARDVATLSRSHGLRAEYMPPPPDDPRRVDFCDVSPELSRGFRGLRVWLPFKLRGARAFTDQLDEKLDLALWAAEELARVEGIEVLAEPELSLVVFRRRVEGGLEERNRANRALLDAVNARQNVFITGTLTPAGEFVLRICVLNFRTHLDRVERALSDIRECLDELAGQRPSA